MYVKGETMRVKTTIKKILITLLVYIVAFESPITVLAGTVSDNQSESTEMLSPGIADLQDQLDEVYVTTGGLLGLDAKYVKIIHLLAGGKAVYADKKPNIYAEETVESMKGPFDIDGAMETEYAMAPWAVCPDTAVDRPKSHYLPDAAYSVSRDIVRLMNRNYKRDRGEMQIYFDALKKDTKINVIFCEAVMEYTQCSEDSVNNFYKCYEKMLYDKQADENVVDIDENGVVSIKGKFESIMVKNGIERKALKPLAIIFSFDEDLAINSSPDSLKESYVLPYKENYTSRENMMIAAMCLTGKVRYVWGGGHGGPSSINGISPVWKEFEQLYSNNEGDESFSTCIKPSGSWCPVHGTSKDECYDKAIYNVQEYIASRNGVIDTLILEDEKFRNLMANANLGKGVDAHSLDGLDCSGYASWVYNQITENMTFDSAARHFTNSSGMKKLSLGSEMLPGDVYAWQTHIIVMVGKVADKSKAYVHIESTPDVIRFGVSYWSGASKADIDLAKQIAEEANQLIGGIDTEEQKVNIFNLSTAGYAYIDEEVREEGGESSNENSEANAQTVSNSTNLETPAAEPVETVDNTPAPEPPVKPVVEPVQPPVEEKKPEPTPEPTPSQTPNPTPAPAPVVEEKKEESGESEEERKAREEKEKKAEQEKYAALAGYYENSQCDEELVEKEDNDNKDNKKKVQTATVGRLKTEFIDEDTVIAEYGKPMKELTAQEIIQYTLKKLPYDYITGSAIYKGSLFDTSETGTKIGVGGQPILEDNSDSLQVK